MEKENIKKIIFVFIGLVFISWQVVFAEEAPILQEEEIVLDTIDVASTVPIEEEVVDVVDIAPVASTDTEEEEPETIPLALFESPTITLERIIIDSGDDVVEVSNVTLPEEGEISISSGGETHGVDARSVLGVLYALDSTDDSFKISELTYYASFNAFYLRCITVGAEKKCDNWLYKIDGQAPSLGMDSQTLSGGEEVEIYFSSFFEEPEPEVEKEVPAEEVEDNKDDEDEAVRSSIGSRRQTPTEEKTVEEVVEIDTPSPVIVTPTEVAVAPKIQPSQPATPKVVVAPPSTPEPEVEPSVSASDLLADVNTSGASSVKPAAIASLLALVLTTLLFRFRKLRQ